MGLAVGNCLIGINKTRAEPRTAMFLRSYTLQSIIVSWCVTTAERARSQYRNQRSDERDKVVNGH